MQGDRTMNLTQDYRELPTWQAMAVPVEEDEQLTRPPSLKFACDTAINGQIKLWYVACCVTTDDRLGNICCINTDAIVNSTNESMTNTTGLSGQILEAAGPEIRAEIYKTEQCRTGEARMTGAGSLPCKYDSLRLLAVNH